MSYKVEKKLDIKKITWEFSGKLVGTAIAQSKASWND